MGNFGTDSLKVNLTNPQRTYLWEVLVPAPIGDGDTLTFQVRAQSTSIPGRKNAPIPIPYKQTAGVRVAGKLEYDHDWTCTFVEGEDHKVLDAVQSWQQAIVHDVAGVGLGDPFYKTDVYLTLQSVAGGDNVKFKMKGAWISSIASLPVGYETNDVVKYNVTFTFDSFEKV